MARRFLRITEETNFGVYNSGNPSVIIRLNGANAFRPLTKPQLYQVMDSSGMNITALVGSQVSMVGGQLVTQLYASQAQFLLGWALQRINAGQTLPWVTTELPYDLASCTVEFGYTYSDGSIKRKRYLGCKVASGSIAGSTDAPVEILSLNILGSTPQGNTFDSSSDPTSGAFPEPALTAYPTDNYVFQHTRGAVTIGTVRTLYDKLGITWQNQMKAYFDESRFANAIKMNGRTMKWSSHLRLQPSPDDRYPTYEVVNASSGSVEFNNGTHTATLNFNGKNFMDNLQEDLPLDAENYYDLDLFSALDTSVAAPNSDLVLAFT